VTPHDEGDTLRERTKELESRRAAGMAAGEVRGRVARRRVGASCGGVSPSLTGST